MGSATGGVHLCMHVYVCVRACVRVYVCACVRVCQCVSPRSYLAAVSSSEKSPSRMMVPSAAIWVLNVPSGSCVTPLYLLRFRVCGRAASTDAAAAAATAAGTVNTSLWPSPPGDTVTRLLPLAALATGRCVDDGAGIEDGTGCAADGGGVAADDGDRTPAERLGDCDVTSGFFLGRPRFAGTRAANTGNTTIHASGKLTGPVYPPQSAAAGSAHAPGTGPPPLNLFSRPRWVSGLCRPHRAYQAQLMRKLQLPVQQQPTLPEQRARHPSSLFLASRRCKFGRRLSLL